MNVHTNTCPKTATSLPEPGIQSQDTDTDMDRNIIFEENSPYQEDIISEMYKGPDPSYLKEPSKLENLIHTTKLVQKCLPKQTDIDKILEIIKRKLLKGTHLPITIK